MTDTTALPPVVDQETWRRELDALRMSEKATTKKLDAIAAQRRRLPKVKMPDYTLVGADGPIQLVDIFGGRSQLIVYNHMWNPDADGWVCSGRSRQEGWQDSPSGWPQSATYS